jgi:hypothetical protein
MKESLKRDIWDEVCLVVLFVTNLFALGVTVNDVVRKHQEYRGSPIPSARPAARSNPTTRMRNMQNYEI